MKSLHAATWGLLAASALSLAAFLFMAVDPADRVLDSVTALVGGLICYALLFWLALSVMDYDIPEQREYLGEATALELGCLGCLLASSLFGFSSKRGWGVITGIVSLVALLVFITQACQ